MFSCFEVAVAGYCSLVQKHQKQADRSPGLGRTGPCLGNSSPEGAHYCRVALGDRFTNYIKFSGIRGAKFSKIFNLGDEIRESVSQPSLNATDRLE